MAAPALSTTRRSMLPEISRTDITLLSPNVYGATALSCREPRSWPQYDHRRRRSKAIFRVSPPVASGRPFQLAARGLDRAGGFVAGHQVVDREHVGGIAFGRMGLADEDRAHELVVAGAVGRASRLERDLGRQLEARQGMGKLHGVERLLLIGDERRGLHRDITEPVARRRLLAGALLDGGGELLHMRHVGLIPPPLHR